MKEVSIADACGPYLSEPQQRKARLLIGKPGSGKIMWARRFAESAWMTEQQALASLSIWQLCGLGEDCERALRQRRAPFRAPHHTVSLAGMRGLIHGGYQVRPGEVSLAHGGVLLLDEVTEFSAEALTTVQVAYSAGEIAVSGRRREFVRVPAEFYLVMAASPCPGSNCQYSCSCDDKKLFSHAAKLERLRDLFDGLEVVRLGARGHDMGQDGA